MEIGDELGGTVTSERWQQVKAVLEEVLELDLGERAVFLDAACQGDEELRQEVEALLASETEAGDFIETPVFRFRLNESAPLAEGQRVGAYRIVHEIGRGGMGSVYLAERADQEFRQRVALKVLRRGMDTDEIVRRFRSERQILANLNHENIAKLLDGGTTEDGRPFFVMEHVEGRPLDEYCDSRKLSTRERLELFRKVCSAVHLAHQNLVVHRDLKPRNILVTSEGVPKLLDFGIAKLLDPEQEPLLTRMDQRAMTPEWASPEQIRGEAITTASDIYSLGVLLYKLLTGKAPYRVDTRDPLALARAIGEAEPPRPSSGDPALRHLAGDLDNIVLKAMQKDPQRRYASVDQFSNDIGRYLDGLPVLARKDTLTYRASKFVARHKIGVTLAGLVLLLIVGAGVTVTLLWRQAVRERERAEREQARAEEVADFVQRAFEVTDPALSRGEDITARQILDSNVERIRKELANQPDVRAEVMNSMGRAYRSIGSYEQARDLHREALRLRRQTLGNNHPKVAESLHNLASALRDLDEDEAAEPLYREGLRIWRQAGETRNENFAAALTNLGAILEDKKQFAEAEALYKESLDLKLELEKGETIDLGRSYNNLGRLYYAQNRDADAESNYRKALAIYDKVAPGQPDPEVAITLDNMASLLESRGERRQAERLYRQSLAMSRKLFGERSSKVAVTLNNLGFLLLAEGRPQDAEPLAREAVSIAKEKLAEDHWIQGMFLRNLAAVLAAQGKGKEGEPLARKALGILRADDPDSWKVATAESVLGSSLAAQGRYAEAEPLLKKSYESLRTDTGEGAKYVSAARQRIADLYTAWGKPEKAAEYVNVTH